MDLGYTKPLYLLPFDHRHSYVTGMFHLEPPLAPQQQARVADSKQVIYEGFQLAVAGGVPHDAAGILVDQEFGAGILRDALHNGYVTAVCTEKSGSKEFKFEYGTSFGRHIDIFNPVFAKALVRYNPADDGAMNRRQCIRLKRLSDYCRRTQRRFMFELLLPPTPGQLEHVRGDKRAYDLELRPDLMIEAIRSLQNAGIEPDVWKIEGLDRREDCLRVVDVARQGGRDRVGCIVLGRGADTAKVADWLRTAASVAGFIGFAVGRTTFWDAVADYESGAVARQEAARRIAARYREWVDIFEDVRPAAAVAE